MLVFKNGDFSRQSEYLKISRTKILLKIFIGLSPVVEVADDVETELYLLQLHITCLFIKTTIWIPTYHLWASLWWLVDCINFNTLCLWLQPRYATICCYNSHNLPFTLVVVYLWSELLLYREQLDLCQDQEIAALKKTLNTKAPLLQGEPNKKFVCHNDEMTFEIVNIK